jgi:DNA-binding CsgD family transcriptional regulator
MPPPKFYSYEEYLDLMADSSGIKMQEETSLIVERFRGSQNIPSRFAPVTFLLDYATRKYIYVDEACFDLLGYNANYFLETGLDNYLNKWHPQDFDLLNRKVAPDCLNFFRTMAAEKCVNIVYSYNYRMCNAKNEYVTLLQPSSYIASDVQGLPAGMIGVVFDITHFKPDLSIVHTIEETVRYNGSLVNNLLFKKVHPILESWELRLISTREMEILKYMAAGQSSKQMADRLNISINTINNHRKNMLAKTNCNSSAELMNYAAKHGLL